MQLLCYCIFSCKAHVFVGVLLIHDMGVTLVASYSETGALGW